MKESCSHSDLSVSTCVEGGYLGRPVNPRIVSCVNPQAIRALDPHPNRGQLPGALAGRSRPPDHGSGKNGLQRIWNLRFAAEDLGIRRMISQAQGECWSPKCSSMSDSLSLQCPRISDWNLCREKWKRCIRARFRIWRVTFRKCGQHQYRFQVKNPTVKFN